MLRCAIHSRHSLCAIGIHSVPSTGSLCAIPLCHCHPLFEWQVTRTASATSSPEDASMIQQSMQIGSLVQPSRSKSRVQICNHLFLLAMQFGIVGYTASPQHWETTDQQPTGREGSSELEEDSNTSNWGDWSSHGADISLPSLSGPISSMNI